MKVALLVILCLGIVCSGTANPWPNVMIQAQDAALANALFQEELEGTTNPPKCDVKERLNYLLSLPNGLQCILSLKEISNSFAPKLEQANALIIFCKKECGGAYTTFLEESCNDPAEADNVRMTCNFQTKI